jgi:hypothetical protein
VTGYGLDDRGLVPGRGKNCFIFPNASRLALPFPPPPPSLLSNVYRGVKRPGREDDHTPPFSTAVKNS